MNIRNQIEKELPAYIKNAKHLAVAITDLLGNYIYVNPTFESYYHLFNDELANKPFRDTVHPEDVNLVTLTARKIVSDPSFTANITFRKPDRLGEYIYTDWEFSAFYLREKFTGIIAIGYNITEKINTQQELDTQKVFLDLIGSLATEGVASFSSDYKLIYASEKFLLLHGYNNINEIKSQIKSIYANVHPEDVELVKRALSEAIVHRESMVQYEYKFKHKDDTYHWHFDTVNILYDQNGNFNGCHVLSKDITKRKEAEFTIERNKQKLQNIIAALPDPILVIDPNGIIIEVLESEASSFSFKKYLNQKINQLIEIKDHKGIYEYLLQMISTNKPLEFSIHKNDTDNLNQHFEGRFSITHQNDIILTARNITVQKQLAAINDKLLLDYQILFNKSTTSIFLIEVLPDNSFKYISTNYTHQKSTGIPLDVIAGKTPEELFGKEIGQLLSSNYKKCLQAKNSINYEETIQLPTGTGTWLTTLDPVIEDEVIKYIIGSSIEITERKRIEKVISEQSQLLNEIKSHITDILIVMTTDGIINFCSDSIATLGYEADEIIGTNAIAIIHPDDQNKFSEIIDGIQQNTEIPSKINLKSITKNGLLRHFEAVGKLIKNQNGSPKEILVVVRDITDTLTYEQELNKTKNLLQQASEMAKIGAYEKNFKNDTDDWSPVTRSIFEVPDDFVPNMENGISFYKEGHDREQIEAVVKKAIEEGIPYELEVVIKTYRNNERWVKVMGATEFEDGKCIRLFGTVQDIHENKLNQIVLEAQNKALKDISWTQSHKVRAPISRIYTLLDLLKLELNYNDDHAIMEVFNYINETLEELDNIVIDITNKTYLTGYE